MKKFFSVSIVMFLTMGLLFFSSAQTPAFAADIELKLQVHYPEVHYTVRTAIKPWMKTVEERSGGKAKIHFFPQRAIAKEEETLKGPRGTTFARRSLRASVWVV